MKKALTLGCFVVFVAFGAWAQDDKTEFDNADKSQHHLEIRDERVALYLADGVMPTELKQCIELTVTSQVPSEFCFGPSGPMGPDEQIGRTIRP